ncbi:aldo/keto reductase [Novosphingobium sp. TH158]|uniref:aldo/keto reductase n=1 Tax=Novosphingobium sp. TH158 TaxID=2067455 RepID=UPI000C7E0344|nr:aldo/keto reductase [Novosphingobium sp. TH158]PLK27734.1 aldo/keto reductase [Novosphingobium sp. TH158]
MEYRQLGRTDLKVSAFGLGVMTFGGQTAEDDAFRQLDMAFDAGITLFDTAENYPTPLSADTQGQSEYILGRWVEARGIRDKVVIATKVAGPGNNAGGLEYIRGKDRRLDAANIRQAVEDSLRRLGTDVIDLYQVHWSERAITTLGRSRFSLVPDAPGTVPIAETLGALGDMVREGKVRAIGVCNESPWGVMEYLAVSQNEELPRIASVQNGYSLLDRSFELGLAEVAMREQTGLIAYSPLAGGTLTGKYGDKPEPIPGSRSANSPAFASRFSEARLQAIKAYGDLARSRGMEPAHMALAFAKQQPFTTSVLMAASRAEQLAGNLGAVDLSLDKELVSAINAIHDKLPNPR